MAHDPRLIKHEDAIEDLKPAIPDWIKNLKRPATPCVVPAFGPLEGIRVVGTGQLVAQPYIGTKLAEFGAEVIHIERPGGDVFRFTAPQLTPLPRGPTAATRRRSPRTSCRWASISSTRAGSSS